MPSLKQLERRRTQTESRIAKHKELLTADQGKLKELAAKTETQTA